MDRVMLDLETLGTSPGSVILSIGAARFDLGGVNDTFYEAIDLEDAAKAGLTIDLGTLRWWMQQGKEARKAAFSGEERLDMALTKFQRWLKPNEDLELWAKSPSFDCVLLEAAYRVCGWETPWHYGQQRDMRTLTAIVSPRQDYDKGTAHNALDDAILQAEQVANCLTQLEELHG